MTDQIFLITKTDQHFNLKMKAFQKDNYVLKQYINLY